MFYLEYYGQTNFKKRINQFFGFGLAWAFCLQGAALVSCVKKETTWYFKGQLTGANSGGNFLVKKLYLNPLSFLGAISRWD